MPEMAEKIYQTALKITEEKSENKILLHPEEFILLTSNKHHIHNHIRTLEKWALSNPNQNAKQSTSSKIQIDQDEVILNTYKMRNGTALKTRHKVSELIKKTKNNKDLILDYTYYSLEKKDEFPKELKPSFKIKGDGKYSVQIVTDCPTKRVNMSGDHAFLRLIDPEGNVISIGKFPKKIEVPFFYAKEATLFSNADRHEWLCRNNTLKSHSFQITKEDYEKLKENIEKDLRIAADEDLSTKQDFNFFNHNCSDWAIDKVNEIGLEIDKSKFQIDQFTILMPRVREFYDQRVPSFMKAVLTPTIIMISYLAFQIIRVSMIYALGGNRVNNENKNSKKFIPNLRQIFNYRLTYLTHPWMLRNHLDKTQEKIQERYNLKIKTSLEKTKEKQNEGFASLIRNTLSKIHLPRFGLVER